MVMITNLYSRQWCGIEPGSDSMRVLGCLNMVSTQILSHLKMFEMTLKRRNIQRRTNEKLSFKHSVEVRENNS